MGATARGRSAAVNRETLTRIQEVHHVAVKILPASVAGDAGRLERFEREARAVAALSHPHVLAVFDVGSADVPYLVTELLAGETLRAELQRGPIPLPRVINIALQLLSGLAAAHLTSTTATHHELRRQPLVLEQEIRRSEGNKGFFVEANRSFSGLSWAPVSSVLTSPWRCV